MLGEMELEGTTQTCVCGSVRVCLPNQRLLSFRSFIRIWLACVSQCRPMTRLPQTAGSGPGSTAAALSLGPAASPSREVKVFCHVQNVQDPAGEA